MEIIPLRCPACGDNMSGLTNDVVFICQRCRDAFELVEKKFQKREILWVAPVLKKAASLIMLPFWKFDVNYQLGGEASSTLKRLEAVEKISYVYVTAFFQRDIVYFGDLGFSYTQARMAYQMAQTPGTVLSASRSRKEAAAYCPLFILKLLDQVEDVTGIEIKIEVKKTTFLGIPFFDFENKLIDSVQGLEIGAGCLDDLNEIRHYHSNFGLSS